VIPSTYKPLQQFADGRLPTRPYLREPRHFSQLPLAPFSLHLPSARKRSLIPQARSARAFVARRLPRSLTRPPIGEHRKLPAPKPQGRP